MTAPTVTDEQLGQVAKRQWELTRRLKEGTLPFRRVMDGLQALIEGETPGPTSPLFNSQQHEAIGRLIKEVLDERPPGVAQAVDGAFLVHLLIKLFGDDNPRFNKTKFLTACGLRSPRN